MIAFWRVICIDPPSVVVVFLRPKHTALDGPQVP
jgi:hypothetical protein